MIKVEFLGKQIEFKDKEELKEQIDFAIKTYQKQKIFNSELIQLKMLKRQYNKEIKK